MIQGRGFLTPGAPVFVARAPGRLDVMGGIADYSGSLVLQLPLDRHTVAMLQPTEEPNIEVVSVRDGHEYHVSVRLDEFLHGAASTPESIADYFSVDRVGHWAAYVFGVAHACLVRNADRVRDTSIGFRMLIESNVPEGKGVSSSAALEVSSLASIAAAYGADLSAPEIALAAQWAENHIARAPCGVMDQMTSACGRKDHLLRLRCQPATIEGHVAIPSGFRFYGIDSGIRHAVTGADYGTVRTAAFMGYRMIAAMSGFRAEQAGDRIRVRDDRWNGYLANISPDTFASQFEMQLPEHMLGEDFLAKFGGITDTATRVNPDRSYPIRVATSHPVRENARVERFATLLGSLGSSPAAASEMGQLMYASHASYGACGLGSDGTDRLVQMVRDSAPRSGLFGAKITGGGSGGTIAILGTDDAESTVRAIAARYEEETGRAAEVFAGSGAGMAETGVLVSLA
ncbi:MAG: kinase [Gemmatimonadetes bacterium]|nr:kinase [Gemmatimonadota bacterium]